MPDRTFGTEAHLAAIGARLVKIQTQQLVIARAISGLRIEKSYLRVCLQGAAARATRSSAAWCR
jgi:hypothetical protein